jgi:DNA-binding XRE family transcriptional regulator|tara:strand:+ start:507 stop:707 length:201 start_codon:yes stop_codon:yes gene_type:complete
MTDYEMINTYNWYQAYAQKLGVSPETIARWLDESPTTQIAWESGDPKSNLEEWEWSKNFVENKEVA